MNSKEWSEWYYGDDDDHGRDDYDDDDDVVKNMVWSDDVKSNKATQSKTYFFFQFSHDVFLMIWLAICGDTLLRCHCCCCYCIIKPLLFRVETNTCTHIIIIMFW